MKKRLCTLYRVAAWVKSRDALVMPPREGPVRGEGRNGAKADGLEHGEQGKLFAGSGRVGRAKSQCYLSGFRGRCFSETDLMIS